MKTFTLSTLCLCAVLLLWPVPKACAEDDSARIRELEDRVRQLEIVVQNLLASQPAGGKMAQPQAALSLASLTTSEKLVSSLPVAASPAAEPPQASAWAAKPLPQELLPNIGKIGATVSFTTGLNSGAFSLNNGSYFGGSVELPLALLPGGRLNYEIGIGLAQASRNLPVTSSVAQVANLTVLNSLFPNGGTDNVQAALTGTGAAPFAVTANANWKAQILQLTPFVLKYDVTRLDRIRLRPYALAGLGTYVTVSSQNVAGSGLRPDSTLSAADLSLISTLLGSSTPFAGSLIAGQISPAPQLSARKLPAGQGGVDLGVHFGGGVEWRITNLASLSVDARFNRVPDGLSYHTLAVRWGLHF